LEIEKPLAVEAKKRQATSTGGSKPQLRERIPEAKNGKASERAAKMLGINPHYITDAEKIEREAPEVLDHVRQGTLSIPQAKKVAVLPFAERPAAIERIRNKEPEEGGDIYRDGKRAARAPRRASPITEDLKAERCGGPAHSGLRLWSRAASGNTSWQD
jgi:hypothetical protein